MNNQPNTRNEQAVLGQKYAFATAALVLGIASFISLLGMEKAVLAIAFGLLALKAAPAPELARRRGWAKGGIVLGVLHVVLVIGILFVFGGAVVGLLQYTADLGNAAIRGFKVVTAVPSPNGNHVAYVQELPSIDPPNQALLVERKDQRHFMPIAHLAGDVDAIERIVWSADSRIVVFQSHDYLTAARVADWQTVRVFLASEWTRHQPKRNSTFTSAGPRLEVEAIAFREPDSFAYRLKGEDRWQTVRFSPLAATPSPGQAALRPGGA